MPQTTDRLAERITKASSKQTFYTIKLLVDRSRQEDGFKAYAYFRWLDDEIDVHLKTKTARIQFIKRQKRIIDKAFSNKKIIDLAPEEQIVVDLIRSHPNKKSKLGSFIDNFFRIIEFDAFRRDKLITEQELNWYSKTLGRAVTDGILYFVGKNHKCPPAKNQYLAATAAHIVHMLRDQQEDIPAGYINIPREYLLQNKLKPDDYAHPAYKRWVRDRIVLARAQFAAGKKYLESIPVLKCKLAGYWYCARFEHVIDTIEASGYLLRQQYSKRHILTNLIGMTLTTLVVSYQHIARKWTNLLY